MAVELFSRRQQGGKEIFGKIPWLPRRDPVHGPAGEEIDAGVHLVGEDLAPGGLFHKALHPPLLIGEHQAVGQGAGVAAEQQGGRRAAYRVEGHGGL